MKLVDAHTHLHFPEFKDDLEATIRRARDAGLQYLINVGTDNETSWQAVDLAKRYDFMYATAGVHPHEAGRMSRAALVEFDDIVREPKVVGIGEVGLDYYRNLSPKNVQHDVLINFFKIAERFKKPLILHIRDAYDDAIKMLRDYFHPPIAGMAHCFSGNEKHLEELVQLGFYISYSGTVTYPKSDALRETVKLCPASRILVETDAPYLAPQPMRGKRNEPSFVLETAKRVAELKGMTADSLGEHVVENTRKLFGIA